MEIGSIWWTGSKKWFTDTTLKAQDANEFVYLQDWLCSKPTPLETDAFTLEGESN